MFISESLQYITLFLLVLVPPVSAGTEAPFPAEYFAILGLIIFIILAAIATRIADYYHLFENFKKRGNEYPEDDGRFEMKVFKGYGFGDEEDSPTPVLYEKRKHDKRGLHYQEITNEVDSGAAPVESHPPPAPVKPTKPTKQDKKQRKEEKERKLREELSKAIGKDAKPDIPSEVFVSPRQPRAAGVISPKARRAMSPPPPNPRSDVPTSPSQKRAMSPPSRRTADPLSPAPPPRTKAPLSPRTRNPLSPPIPRKPILSPKTTYKTLPSNKADHTGAGVAATSPAGGYSYSTLPAGYYPPHPGAYPHPGGYPPVAVSPVYPGYPYPHPAVPGHPGAPGYPPGAPAVEGAAPLPAQPGAYHMAYPYPHPGYYPPHPAYPPTTPGVSQSKHQSQL